VCINGPDLTRDELCYLLELVKRRPAGYLDHTALVAKLQAAYEATMRRDRCPHCYGPLPCDCAALLGF
jgi:hypothetical protein